MATSTTSLVCDSSNLTNFKSWAQAISSFFTTAGWIQSTDTGQVNWSTISTVPSSAYVYELWKPGDALTTFWLKIGYGNYNTSNSPSVTLQMGTTSNGSSTLTGLTTATIIVNNQFTAPSSSTTYNCYFSGSASRIAAMMWRNGINNCQTFFAVERSVDTSGNYTGTYATAFTVGCNWSGGADNNMNSAQYTLHFTAGQAPASPSNQACSTGGLIVRCMNPANNHTTSASFNGNIPFDTCSPVVGYYDNPCTVVGCINIADIIEATTFTVTLYGTTRTYLPSYQGGFSFAGPSNALHSNFALCMRYD